MRRVHPCACMSHDYPPINFVLCAWPGSFLPFGLFKAPVSSRPRPDYKPFCLTNANYDVIYPAGCFPRSTSLHHGAPRIRKKHVNLCQASLNTDFGLACMAPKSHVSPCQWDRSTAWLACKAYRTPAQPLAWPARALKSMSAHVAGTLAQRPSKVDLVSPSYGAHRASARN